MHITLIRHPQTKANKSHIIYGTKDYDYTTRGENQLQWIREYMSMNYKMDAGFNDHPNTYHVISSPRKRANQLAKSICEELNIECHVDELIREMNFGIFEGLTVEEAKVRYPDEYFNFQYHFDTTAIPEGESYADFIHRIDGFLDYLGTLYEKKTYDEIIVVTHGGVIRELVERLLELEPGTSWKFAIGNGCIIKLVHKNGGYHMRELIANKF